MIHICICGRAVSPCKIIHKLLCVCAISNSALTTKLLKEGTTIETLGGFMDPEVRGDTLCCQFLKFYSG
jgi:hypothetical protein